jgi:hypothetical protein
MVVGDTETTQTSTVDRRGCRHQVDARSSHSIPKGFVVTKSTRGRHTVDQWGCRHQVDKRSSHSPRDGDLVTESTKRGYRHQVGKTGGLSSPSQPKGVVVTSRQEVVTQSTKGGLSSPSRQEVVSQSTKGGCRNQVDKKGGIIVTKSTRRGLSSPVDRRSSHSRPKGLLSPSQQEGDVVTKPTRGRHTVDRRRGGHQVNPRRWSSQGVSTDRVEEVD